MTLEKDSFEGLMGALNLDPNEFVDYKIHDELNYQQLSLIKTDLEKQLTKLFDLLNNKFKVTMDTALVSADGFPRDDIDVVSIRLIRVKIIRLRNDHRQLLSMIEAKLIDQFNQSPDANSYTDTNTSSTSSEESIYKLLEANIPFARIDQVVDNSPAATAGLQPGDKLVVFDNDIHAGNHNKLVAVVNRVKDNVDKSLTVHVVRPESDHAHELKLTPTNNWHGNGLLGCKLVPL